MEKYTLVIKPIGLTDIEFRVIHNKSGETLKSEIVSFQKPEDIEGSVKEWRSKVEKLNNAYVDTQNPYAKASNEVND